MDKIKEVASSLPAWFRDVFLVALIALIVMEGVPKKCTARYNSTTQGDDWIIEWEDNREGLADAIQEIRKWMPTFGYVEPYPPPPPREIPAPSFP